MATYLTHYYASHDAEQAGVELLKEPVLGDANDFTRIIDTRSEEDAKAPLIEILWDSFTFTFWPYFLLATIFIALTQFNSNFSDMVAVGYLIFAIYFVSHFRSFYTKNVNMLRSLRVYNMIVLALYMVFQAPVFLCPGIP